MAGEGGGCNLAGGWGDLISEWGMEQARMMPKKSFWAVLAAAMAAGMAVVCVGDEVAPEVGALGLEDCVRLALERNLDLQVRRLARTEAEYDIGVARGAYDPEVTLEAGRTHVETGGESGGTAEGVLGTMRSESDEDLLSAGVGGQLGWLGTRYEISAKNGETSGTRGGTGFETSTARVGASITQPLLKGLRTDSSRFQVASAKVLSEEAALEVEAEMQSLLAGVEKAWYGLLAARQSRTVQEEAVALAEQLLADNRRKVQIGAMSALDEKQAEAQAASARADLARAEQAVTVAENELKTVVWADLRSVWRQEMTTEGALEVPPPGTAAPDAGIGMENALARRPELRRARLELERQGLAVELYRDQRLPGVDLKGGYGLAATGADSASDAWSTVSDADEPYWNVGVTVTIPIGNRTARNRHLQSLAAQDRARLQLRKLEESTLAEVINAAAAAEACLERIEATRDAAEYALDALNAEQRKLEQGKSTSFVVLQLQKDLTAARQAETVALADYHQALADFSLAEGSMLERHGIVLGE